MAEYTANAVQEITANSNVIFTDVAVKGNNAIYHRDNSGLITLRAIPCCQTRARFRVMFNANIAIPENGTVESISASITLDNEPILITNMIVTPAATNEYFNIAANVNIDVPTGCCTQLSIKNVSEQTINMQNANIIIERIA